MREKQISSIGRRVAGNNHYLLSRTVIFAFMKEVAPNASKNPIMATVRGASMNGRRAHAIGTMAAFETLESVLLAFPLK
jgi:hypothetical protein